LVLALSTVCFWLVAATGHSAIIPRLQNGEHLNIAAIGTSLSVLTPWFADVGAWLNEQGYPGNATLYNKAESSSASAYTATYTSPPSGLEVQLGNALQCKPDAIFIEFAYNDAYRSYGISPAMSKANLKAMIGQIRDWEAKNHKTVDIVLQTMNNDPYGYRDNLNTYYQGYRDVAAENGLLLVDNYTTWVDLYDKDPAAWKNTYVPDGIHPNAAGAEAVIVPNIQAALLGQVPEPASTVLWVTLGGCGAAIYACRRWLRKR
jgi:lysophospholipase L1-like esterase